VVIWKNLDGVFAGIAELLIFDLAKTPFGMHLSRFLAIVVIAGTVRFPRLRGMTAYLLVWPGLHRVPAGLALPTKQPLPIASISPSAQASQPSSPISQL
jgi:hypothetical protein